MSSRVLIVSGLLFVFLSFTEVNAQDTVKTAAPVAHPTDTMWMVFSSLLVIMMSLPGLALFYGGMVRSKNMISVLMQVFSLFCLITVLWVIYGYSFAFTGGSAFIGSWDKLFLSGVTPASMAATFTKGACAFAAITVGLIVGAFAERAKFSAVILFSVLWFTVSYLPVAHMVWYWDGPDAITDAASAATVSENAGFLWRMGALDFAGGTVIHINAAIAGLVGAYMIGKRVGYGVDQMAPHSLPLNMIGAALLWVGWFGFNAGSALALDSVALQAILNTLIAAATAVSHG
ncbi:hypothetical protein CHS0354_027401 [Potamilus streckersoni]|uniref:Ammonium transporter AmtB-like domain-containing protein n=1 Tax=Potamilus streckersoni TaxID=2493646 RepID=A0AAE0VZR2_9BIVA|nr:hypothetical protein CHS0354_027401 [Potamilus streckersoni]